MRATERHAPARGSPPRARGQGPALHRKLDRVRFTPACAGTGTRPTSTARATSVHPRVRGDRAFTGAGSSSSYGSPPRARGQVKPNRRSLRRFRFTPACAGTGRASAARRPGCAVHPRVRGDRRDECARHGEGRGSPPRARGQAQLFELLSPFARFTPACAGTGSLGFSVISMDPVHPRVRGDRRVKPNPRDDVPGSPPRARGQGGPGHLGPAVRRFTPACAGTGLPGSRARRRGSVHPRVRGDRRRRGRPLRSRSGSPPRARGQDQGAATRAWDPRFTPACAGTGAGSACRRPPSSVHPRVRGDRMPEDDDE